MKETVFIILFGVFIYLGVATILGDSGVIGSYGTTFAAYNHKYFGYISFVYLLVLLIPLYFLYKSTQFNTRKAEIAMASFLLLFAALLAQALLVENEFRGKIGADFVDFLAPYIGSFGVWIFWSIITLVSFVIILDKSTHELLAGFSSSIKNKIPTKENKEHYNTPTIEQEEPKTLQNKMDEKFTIDNTKETELEEDPYDTPSYLRKKEENINEEVLEAELDAETIKEEKHQKKPHNILDLASKVKEQKNTLVVEELEENAKLLESIEKGEVEKPKNFTLPSTKFLQKPDVAKHSIDESELDDKIRYLIDKLAHFKIDGDVVRTYAGPVVSTFEFKPAANVKVSKILNLQDDLAMALSAETIRIQAPIPGKDVVGIEIPNEKVDTIYLRELLESKLFKEAASPLTIVLGKDIVGKPFVTDLKKLPHLLIAGTTGSGKSVGINAMILSLLYKNSPDQLRLLMIDPKMLEFSTYNDIPHLLTPVITKPKQAIVALNNMV